MPVPLGSLWDRNVFQHPEPAKIAAALHAIVHDNASVDSAMKLVS